MLQQHHGHLLMPGVEVTRTVCVFCPSRGTHWNWPAQNLLPSTGQALLFDEEKISSREDLNLALTDLEDLLSARDDEVSVICSVLSSQEWLKSRQGG